MKKKNTISQNELLNQLNDKKIIILDTRWSLNEKKSYLKSFEKSHIPNAIFFDLNKYFDKENSIPHMLPKRRNFSYQISELGIKNSHKIIVYDENGFFNSARVWFMFRYFGHLNIFILDGGFKNWIKNRLPVQNKKNILEKSKFIAKINKNLVIDKLGLKRLIKNKTEKFQIIDARPKNRFLSIENEPRQGINKGNIVGSVNFPFNLIHNKKGYFISEKKLKNIFLNYLNFKNEKIIVTCGSGITACNIIFALDYLCFKQIILYDGSWAEWGKK